jgi:hypothetical protein
LAEAIEQFRRGLEQIALLPPTPTLRRDQITFQVALITPLIHIKGYAAPETKAAAEQARLLIEQAEALGEPRDDPLSLFSVLYSAGGNGTAMLQLAEQFLARAEKEKTTASLMIGHRLMGTSLAATGLSRETNYRTEFVAVLNNQPQGGFLMRRPTVDVRVASRNHWGNDGFGFFFQRNWNSQPAYTRPRAGQHYEMQQRWW